MVVPNVVGEASVERAGVECAGGVLRRLVDEWRMLGAPLTSSNFLFSEGGASDGPELGCGSLWVEVHDKAMRQRRVGVEVQKSGMHLVTKLVSLYFQFVRTKRSTL